jgi:hypothetical protein
MDAGAAGGNGIAVPAEELLRASPGFVHRPSAARLVDASALLPSFDVVLRILEA